MFERRVSDLARRACDRAPFFFGPHIIRATFRLGNSYDGDPAIFFNVLLSDDVAKMDTPERTMIIGRCYRFLEEWSDCIEHGRFPYFNVRSVSEQAKLKDPEWE